MNHVSIFEKKWLDLVFEGKNKNYGAYQLRLENPRTTLLALFFGLLLLTSAVGVSAIINKMAGGSGIAINEPIEDIIHLSNYNPKIPTPPKAAVAPVSKKEDLKEEKQLHDPVIVTPIDADDMAKNKDNKPSTPTTPGTGTPGVNPTPGNPGTPGVPATVNPGGEIPGEVNPSYKLDKLPEFPNGIDNFYKYISRNFEKPEINDAKSLRVYVTFVIEKDGTMTDIKVTRDPGYGLGKEAIRVLKSLKVKWEPGLIKGQPVRTAYSLPITVNME